jgi:hypothetical protein
VLKCWVNGYWPNVPDVCRKILPGGCRFELSELHRGFDRDEPQPATRASPGERIPHPEGWGTFKIQPTTRASPGRRIPHPERWGAFRSSLQRGRAPATESPTRKGGLLSRSRLNAATESPTRKGGVHLDPAYNAGEPPSPESPTRKGGVLSRSSLNAATESPTRKGGVHLDPAYNAGERPMGSCRSDLKAPHPSGWGIWARWRWLLVDRI